MMESLDDDLIRILEDLFDGDDHLPNADELEKKVDALEDSWRFFLSSGCCGVSGKSGKFSGSPPVRIQLRL